MSIQTVYRAALLLFLAVSAVAVEIPLGDLRLPGGEVLTNAVAIGNNPTGINVRHASGVTFVHYRHLPPTMRTRLGYDPAKERAYYQQINRQRLVAVRKKRAEEAKKQREEGLKKREEEIKKFQKRLWNLENHMIGVGTGFFITPDGYVMTCEHVIRQHTWYKRSLIKVVWLDRIFDAKLEAYDAETDFAILKLQLPDDKQLAEMRRAAEKKKEAFKPPPKEFPFLPLSREEAAPLGTKVFTIGFPQPVELGWAPKLADGTISSVRGWYGQKLDYQLSMPVHGGNSGGAVIDYGSGGALGVVYSKWNGQFGNDIIQSISYASKIRPSKDTLKKVKNFPYEKLRFVNADNTVANREHLVDYARRSSVAIMTLLPPRRDGVPFDE